jgi:hypothetical protein
MTQVQTNRGRKADRYLRPPDEFVHEFEHRAFDSKKAAKVLQLIAEGRSQDAACKMIGSGMSRVTLQVWALQLPGFAKGLEMATRLRFMAAADDMLSIASDGSKDFVATKVQSKGKTVTRRLANPVNLQRDALRIRTLQWLLPKVLPDKYGLLMGTEAPDKPADAPAWLKLCSPKTQFEVAVALAKAKAEGESRVILQEALDEAASERDVSASGA